MSGYDLSILVHLHDGSHAEALAAGDRACGLLADAGFLITRRPTLPHQRLSTPEEFEAFMRSAEEEDNE